MQKILKAPISAFKLKENMRMAIREWK